MHIPDGYVGPQTYGAAYLIMAPIWAMASRVLRKSLGRKQAPLLALGAAFCFIVMFLNVPVMGRLTAHPVGAVLVAIVCGPWAACVAITAALAIQAVPFGDGGITTFGLNCLNMAVIMPFVGWAVFKLSSGSKPSMRRLWISALAAGFAGIVAASAAVGIEIGLQPHLAAQGMYLPYSIKTSLAAMLLPHLLIVGPIEGVLTAAAVRYIRRTEPEMIAATEKPTSPITRRLSIITIVLLMLAPLGILLPKWFGAGAAWAEWGPDELESIFGYVPKAIEKGTSLWRAPMPDYAFLGKEATPVSIVIVGAIGALVVIGLSLAVGKLLSRRREDVTS
jgi:cobalt/nickel transport system permease protein